MVHTWLVLCRIGPHELIVEIDAPDVGYALLEAANYLQTLDPYAIYEVYEIKRKTFMEVMYDDLILN